MNPVDVRSEVAGNVLEVACRVGGEVAPDEVLVLVESMKMEIPMTSPVRGIVVECRVAVGDAVAEGDVLARVQPLA